MDVAYVFGKITIKLLQETVSIPYQMESQHESSVVLIMSTQAATNIHTLYPSQFTAPGTEMFRDAPVLHPTSNR